MRWTSQAVLDDEPASAVGALAEQVKDALEGQEPDLVFAFAGPSLDDELAARLDGAFPLAVVVGAAAAGVIGGHRELEGRSALSLTAARLPATRVHVQAFGLELGRELEARHLHASLAPDGTPPALVVALLDPRFGDPSQLLESLDQAFPDAVIVGGMASGPANRPALLVDGRASGAGGVLVALQGGLQVEPVVAQGCKPIGEPMLVTRVDRHLIQELGQSRPVEVMRALHQSLGDSDRALFERALFLGVEMRDQLEYQQGDFLIRNVLGIEPRSGSLAVAAAIDQWKAVQFHLRDADTSAEDLRRRLNEATTVARSSPEVALLFSCVGRGEGLYGEASHDTRVIREVFKDIPVGGFFANGEIGPVAGKTHLHGYTSAIALVGPSATG